MIPNERATRRALSQLNTKEDDIAHARPIISEARFAGRNSGLEITSNDLKVFDDDISVHKFQKNRDLKGIA
jgi:hypothetical protein